MTVALIVQIIIALIVAGFVIWAGRLLIPLLPIDEWFKQVINVLLVIAAAAIVIFYAVIPVLHALAGVNISIAH